MQYTIRNIPQTLDKALRERAKREDKSLNEIAIEALLRDFGLSGRPARRRDLSDIAGTWIADHEVDRALDEQREIDDEMWR